MWLVFLHGPPAAEKLTVGRSLQSLTGYSLFHNHLAVDLLESVFEFGSEPFVRLRERLWLEVFREAARARRSPIFTFAPERTVGHGFPAAAESVVESGGGRVLFVALRCAEAELERRVSEPSRARFGKLNSLHRYRELRDAGALAFPPFRADVEIDTGSLSAERAAAVIHARLVAGLTAQPSGLSPPREGLPPRRARSRA